MTHVIVAGGGVMGAATAWALTGRGVDVTLLEQHRPRHTLGSSHGSGRIFRIAYHDRLYAELAATALPLWRRLESQSDLPLLTLSGAVDHGPHQETRQRARILTDIDVAYELLDPRAAQARWPGMRFDTSVLHHPAAGRVDADAAVEAFTAVAISRGAKVHYGHQVVSLTSNGSGVAVVTSSGVLLEADAIVLAAGAWSATLAAVAGIELPPLRVTLEQPVTFPTPHTAWPSFIHHPGAGLADPHGIYGLGVPEGVKVGAHARGRELDPRQDDRSVDPLAAREVVDYARRWLPGVDPRHGRATGCLYTLTADHDFVIDRVGDVVVLAGFSGHGFKFAPAVGELAADLVTGAGHAPSRFARLSASVA